jgi:hypothetical protein
VRARALVASIEEGLEALPANLDKARIELSLAHR